MDKYSGSNGNKVGILISTFTHHMIGDLLNLRMRNLRYTGRL